jgi:predicted dehydrogenase
MTKKLNRRDFLKSSITTAAVFGIPAFIPSSVLGKIGNGSPNERINLGFIGLGTKGFVGCWGSLLHSFIEYDTVQIRAVCDVDKSYQQRAKAFVDDRYQNQDCAMYTDFRDMLARKDIDAVVIATPDHWHAIQMIQACEQGKDVYCEKPLSLTIDEARAMVNTARKYDRVVQTGSQSRSNQRIRFACEAVKGGRLGKLLSVKAACGGPSIDYNLPAQPTPEHLDWDMWIGPAPWRPFNSQIHPAGFRAFKDFSGGSMTDWGAHHFDIAQWALGMDKTGPTEILPPDGKNRKRLTFKYANGLSFEHVDIGREPNEYMGVTFTGTDGTIRVQGISGEAMFEPREIGRECDAAVQKASDLYSNMGHYDNFLECVRTRKKPIADVEIGARSVSVAHLGNIAYWLNRPIRWNPDREEIIDDAEASRYLSRAKREPWTL